MSTNANDPINVKIGIPSRIPSQDPNRAGKYDLLIPVEYGAFNRMAVTMPEDTATPGAIEAEVRAQIMKLKLLGNKTIQV